MKKTTLLVISALISGGAFADAEPKVYVSPEVSIVKADCPPELTCTDTTGFGIGLNGGVNITDHLGIEFGYLRASGFSVQRYRSQNKVKLSTFKVGGKARFNVSEDFGIFGKGGVHKWKSKEEGGSSVDGMNPFFGGGFQYQASKKVVLEAALTHYIFDEEEGNLTVDVTANAFSGALVFEL